MNNGSPAMLLQYTQLMGDIKEEHLSWLKHVWISYDGSKAGETVLAPPLAYSDSYLRTIYIHGVPSAWTSPAFQLVFNTYGKVEACPVVIDITSGETFRWIVMETVEGAAAAMDAVHEMVFQDAQLLTCMALKPGRNLDLVEGWKRLKIPAEDSQDQDFPQDSLHRHPSPGLRGCSTRPPIPIITLPTDEPMLAMETNDENHPPPHLTIHVAKTRPRGHTKSSSSLVLPPKSPFPDEIDDDPTPRASNFATVASTWANIAGNVSPNSRSFDLTEKAQRIHPVGRIPSISNPNYAEPMVDQARLVFLMKLPNNITLTDISDAIREGPVVALRMGVDETDNQKYCGVIFQYATDAEKFEKVLANERAQSRPGRFRFLVESARGEPCPMDEDIRSMGRPTLATRRITIAKKGFFFLFPERNLRHFCEKLVGPGNIQLIFLYNGGNGTVVFAEVSAARKVKKALEARRDR